MFNVFERVFNLFCFMALFAVSIDCLFDAYTDSSVIPVVVFSGFICIFGIGFNAVNLYRVHSGFEPINL